MATQMYNCSRKPVSYMNGDLSLDPNLDLWYGEIEYEYEDEDCDDPNLRIQRKKYSIVNTQIGRKRICFVIPNRA